MAPEYVVARGVLLDALAALDAHRDSMILVGAQAVYFHTGAASVNVPLMTTDADLAIDVDRLSDAPEIGGVLRAAGFLPGAHPGHWVSSSDVAVDLMVVPHQSGSTKTSARAARLAPHNERTARIARGLEPALLDHHSAEIAAFDPADERTFRLRVAGPAALLTAKAIKIGERLQQAETRPGRLKDKDALDVFRILQAVEIVDLVRGFARHREDEHAASVTTEAIELFRTHGGASTGRLPQLASAAASGDPTVAPAFASLMSDLLAELDRSRHR